MRTASRISSIFLVVVYVYFSFYPVALLSEYNFAAIHSEEYISSVALEHCDEYLAEGNVLKIADIHTPKFVNWGKLQFKPLLKSQKFLFLKKYLLSNALYFNLPLISYKFPRSEHTEEG